MASYKQGDEPVPGYRLIDFLGRGGFGEVWRASGPGDIHVALKIISLDRKQGLKECKALRLVKGIHHPNLVPIMGFWLIGDQGDVLDDARIEELAAGEGPATGNFSGTLMVSESGSAYPKELIIAMGLGDMSLGDRLEQCPSGIPIDELLETMREAAKAIDFLNERKHDLGSGPVAAIQHCDIKPQNILLVGGAAQVCDFGLARVLGDVRMTSVAVSPAYGAPECLDGNAPSPTTDQYSLAISYVELRTGELPFVDTTSYLGIINAHMNSDLDLSRLSLKERDVIKRATARDPAKRYASTLAMVRALRKACPIRDSAIVEPKKAEQPVPADAQVDSAASEPVASGVGVSTTADPPTSTRDDIAATRTKEPQVPAEDQADTASKQTDVPRKTDSHSSPLHVTKQWGEGQTPAPSETMVPDMAVGEPEQPDTNRTEQVQATKTTSNIVPTRREPASGLLSPGTSRRRLIGGLAVFLLAAAAAIIPVLKARNIRADAETLTQKGEYQAAFEQIEGTPAWCAWLVPADELRNTLKTKWCGHVDELILEERWEAAAALVTDDASWIEALAARPRQQREDRLKESWRDEYLVAAAKGEGDQSEQIRLALLEQFPNYAAAKTPARKPGQGAPLQPEILLKVVESLLNDAWDLLDSDPDTCIQKCNDAEGIIDRIATSDIKDAALRTKVQQATPPLRQQILLLRARAYARAKTPPWTSVGENLDRLDQIVTGKTSAGRDALRTVLRLQCEAANPTMNFDQTLAAVKDCRESVAGAERHADRWSPNEVELTRSAEAEAKLLARLRQSIEEATQQPEQAIGLADKYLADYPDQFDVLLIKADMQLQLERFDDRLKTLQHAMPLSSAAQQKEMQTQIAILTAARQVQQADPNTQPDQIRSAAAKLSGLRDQVPPGLLTQFAQRLLVLAQDDPVLRQECLQWLAEVLGALPSSDEKQQLTQRMAVLKKQWAGQAQQQAEALREKTRRAVIARIESNAAIDFADLLRQCKAARAQGIDDPLIRLCQAECLLETADAELTAADRREIDQAADAKTLLDGADAKYGPYALYIRSLIESIDSPGSLATAAELLQQAYKETGTPPVVSNEYRQRRAGQLLTEAALGLRPSPTERSFETLLGASFPSPADAEKAFAWLTLATRLAGDRAESASAKLHRAMAALGKSSPDRQLAEQLLTGVVPKRSTDDLSQDQIAALYLMTTAKSRGAETDGERLSAVLGYAELLRLARLEETSGKEPAPALVLYEKIIQPAESLIDQLPDSIDLTEDQRKQLGRIWGEKGRLIHENRNQNWPLDDPDAIALDAFDRAVAYDGTQAVYFAGRGLCYLGKGDLVRAEADGIAALQIDKKCSDAHSLLANVFIDQSRQLDNIDGRLAKLRDAIKASTAAIGLSQPDSEEMAYALINRSTTLVEVVNYGAAAMTQPQMAEQLELARDDATRAIEIDTIYNDYAHQSLGNVLEDSAWLAGLDAKLYDEAIEHFQTALRLSMQSNATYWMAVGRCKFKAVGYGGADPKLLESAAKELTEAIHRKDDLAEAHYWLGQIHLYQKKYVDAETSFANAVKHDPGSSRNNFTLAQVLVERDNLPEADKHFSQAVTLASEAGSVRRLEYLTRWAETIDPDQPNTKTRAAAFVAVAADLSKRKETAPHANLFIGLTRELQQQWAAAADAYSRGLGSMKTDDDRNLRYKLAFRKSKANYNLLMSLEADKAKQQEAAKQIGDRLYLDADDAAKAAGNSNDRAPALAQAAIARGWLAMALERENPRRAKLWQEARQRYEDAIKLAPNHQSGWTWRFAFVSHWQFFDPKIYQKGSENAQAVRFLVEILQSSGPGQRERDVVGRMKTELERAGR